MNGVKYFVFFVVALGAGFFIHGFISPSGGGAPAGATMQMPEAPPASVIAVKIAQQPLDVQQEYIASVEPVQEVYVRSEVPGYIDKVHFREGSMVKAGDLLLTIDQEQYVARVNMRKAELASAQAELVRSEKYLKRMQEVSHRSVSETEIDTAESQNLKAQASLKQAQANLELAEIDLKYSQIKSPISGRIGSAALTKGNYVTSASEPLARIVQTDPIRVVFSITDREYLGFQKTQLSGQGDALAAQVRLPDGTMLDRFGKKDFDDNAIDPQTGSMAVRFLFDNPDDLLVAGGYVNILLGKQGRPMGIKIPQKALLADADGNYVLTADAEGLVGSARVQTGNTIASDVVILSGLTEGDVVIVDGLQKVQPGAKAAVTLQEVSK